MSALTGSSSSPQKMMWVFSIVKITNNKLFLMEKVGGDQNNYVYKGRLIVSVFEHKLYIAHTTFQDWICSIIFLVLLSFLNG